MTSLGCTSAIIYRYGQMSTIADVCACSTLCDPYLNLFRGIIPPLNGTIDLSPILAFIALDVSSPSAFATICLYAAASLVESHGSSSWSWQGPPSDQVTTWGATVKVPDEHECHDATRHYTIVRGPWWSCVKSFVLLLSSCKHTVRPDDIYNADQPYIACMAPPNLAHSPTTGSHVACDSV